MPTLGDSEVLHVPERRRVEERGERTEPISGFHLPIVEKVAVPRVLGVIVRFGGAQDSTRLRKFRSPSPKKSARKAASTG
jgi:hypothetical protein